LKNESALPSINFEKLLKQFQNAMPHYFLKTKSRAIRDLQITYEEDQLYVAYRRELQEL